MVTRWNPTRRCVQLSLLLVALPLGGCMTAATQAFHEFRGARGEIMPMANVALTDEGAFGDIAFEPAMTTVSDLIIPRDLLTAYDRRTPVFVENIRAANETGGPKLTIRTELIYFQAKGFMSPAMLLSRVRFAAGERLVQDAIVKVESKAFRAGDEASLANATLTAIEAHSRAFFKPRSPAERKRRQEELQEQRANQKKSAKSRNE